MKTGILFGVTPTSGLVYASVKKRVKAFLFDYAIIFGYIVLLAGANYGFILSGGALIDTSALFTSPWIKDGLAFLTLVLPVILYFTYMESLSHPASLGKRKFGLLVVSTNGGRLTLRQALFRNLIKFLPWQIAHSCIFHIQGWPTAPESPSPPVIAGFVLVWGMVAAYLASLLFTKSRRAPYDWAACTCVIEAA